MILLDANVISELMRPRPEARVEAWLAAQSPADCFLSAITEAELRYGIEILPSGQRRQQFQIALTGTLEVDLAGRILSFDSAAANAYATIADRRQAGRPISQMDAQIAAIARSTGAV
jgi:predicted nucleic acid-binding protein